MSQSFWAHQLVEPGIVFALLLTGVHRAHLECQLEKSRSTRLRQSQEPGNVCCPYPTPHTFFALERYLHSGLHRDFVKASKVDNPAEGSTVGM